MVNLGHFVVRFSVFMFILSLPIIGHYRSSFAWIYLFKIIKAPYDYVIIFIVSFLVLNGFVIDNANTPIS